MDATYAQETKAQGSPKVQRVAFSKGAMYGHLEVIEDTKYCQSIPVRCTRTGKTLTLSGSALYEKRKGRGEFCPACDTRRTNWNNTGHSKFRNCTACSDCPALRPYGGYCQACGQPGNGCKTQRITKYAIVLGEDRSGKIYYSKHREDGVPLTYMPKEARVFDDAIAAQRQLDYAQKIKPFPGAKVIEVYQ